MNWSSMGPRVAADRPARVRAEEPSRRDTYRRERPPRRRGVADTVPDTPQSPCRASGTKGGVAPVLALAAGAVRVVRSKTKNPNNDSGNGSGVA